MRSIWVRQDPGGPHFGPMIVVIWVFTINRALSVCMPLKVASLMPTRTTITLLGLIYVVSLGLHTPYILFLEAAVSSAHDDDQRWLLQKYHPIMQLTVMGYIRDVIIVLGNIVIVIRTCQFKRNRAGKVTSGTDFCSPVVRTCVGLGIFPIVTRLPLMASLTYDTIADGAVSQLMKRCYLLLSTVNNAGNFILYIMLSPSFRESMKTMFVRRFLTCRKKLD